MVEVKQELTKLFDQNWKLAIFEIVRLSYWNCLYGNSVQPQFSEFSHSQKMTTEIRLATTELRLDSNAAFSRRIESTPHLNFKLLIDF